MMNNKRGAPASAATAAPIHPPKRPPRESGDDEAMMIDLTGTSHVIVGAGGSGRGAATSTNVPQRPPSSTPAVEVVGVKPPPRGYVPTSLLRPPPPPPSSSSSSAVVTIDDDDDEDEEEEYGDAYFGQITSKVVGIQYYSGVVSRGEAVFLRREPHNQYDRNAIMVKNVRNEKVGHVPAVLAKHLAPIMDAFSLNDFRVEGVVPNPGQNTYSMQLQLYLRGSEAARRRVDGLLIQASRLQGHKSVGVEPGQVGPPQAGKKSAAQATRGPSATEIISRELEKLYQSNTSFEDMPIADAPRLLKSSLHLHQAKALHWMVQAERDINVAQVLAERQQAAASAGGDAAGGKASKKVKGGGKKVAAAAAVASSTVFFYERREDKEGRTLYYNIATDSASLTPPKLARGGVLADDMGLGKTITVLALIAADQEQSSRPSFCGAAGGGAAAPAQPLTCRRPTLVVCPLSVISNWEEQVREHVGIEGGVLKNDEDENGGQMVQLGGAGLCVAVYHGKEKAEFKPSQLQGYDLVITTYQTLARDFKKSINTAAAKKPSEAVPTRRRGLLAVPWLRVVLDEGHSIKNRTSLTAAAAFQLDAERRWVLSGTPIQNRIDDLFSLVRFLRIEPFDDFSWFNRLIMRPVQNQDLVGFERLQLLIRFHCLRRTKDMKIRFPDGSMRSLITLPPKHGEILSVNLSPEDREAYDALHAFARGFFSVAFNSQEGSRYSHVFSLLTRLRLLCEHPSLIPNELVEKVKRIYSISGARNAGGEGAAALSPAAMMEKAIKDLGEEGVKRLLGMLDQKTAEEEECTICLEDGAEIITRCAHIFHKDCLTRAITQKNPMAAQIPAATAPCPNCRTPISLTEVMVKGAILPGQKQQEEDKEAVDEEAENGGIKPSAKIDAVWAKIQANLAQDPAIVGNKTVVFSSFTSFFDLLGPMLREHEIDFRRLDGKTSREKRAQALSDFQEDPSINVILISLKAGGMGLNLTKANHCILCEPWWNPSVEDQAIDRLHRIGQEKPVYVTRMITTNTVEETLLLLQENKRQLADASFHKSREELRQINFAMLRSVFE